MPPRPPAAHDSNRATLMGLAPELSLLAAVLMQAVHDARSRRADIRADALQFLQDEEALTWWGHQLGVGEVLQQQVRNVLRDGR